MSFPLLNDKLDTPAARVFAFFRLVRERIFCAKTLHASSFMDIAVLSAAAEHKNPSMKDIADFLRIASPPATVLIDRLVDKGELVRTEDAEDRRVVRLSVTESGRKALKLGLKEAEEGMHALLSVLNKSEQADFDRLIGKILSAHA